MTYDIYAMYREGAYLVATSNNADHGMNMTERVCKELNQWPMAITALIRGEHTLKANIFTLEDLKKRK